MNIVLQFDPTPRPIRCYSELWGASETTLNQWCRKGWVPGAYRLIRLPEGWE